MNQISYLCMLSRDIIPDRRIPPLVVMSLVLVGCTTPEQVREFVTTARDATSQFSSLARDLGDSCVRRTLAQRPVMELSDASSLPTEVCKEEFDLAPDLVGAINVLASYFNALNQLASDEVVSYDKEIDGFASNLQTSAKLDGPTVDAVKALSKVLANATASGYRRKQLAECLRAADPDVGKVTTSLGHVIGVEYFRILDNEEESLRKQYFKAMKSTQQNEAVALLLQQQWATTLATVQGRKSAAKSYQKVLEKVRIGHAHLADQSLEWKPKELANELGPYTSSIQTLIRTIQSSRLY